MAYKRILTMQDISCVGQCSMTVAMPILSAWGNETCILPTALLSTHTGGFGQPAVIHFEDMLEPILQHWKENSITFDAVLIGYLGSTGAVAAAHRVLDTLLAPGGISIVDPAMADHGRLYSGLTEEYAQAMERLCRRADIMIPNITEAARFAGVEFLENYGSDYVNHIMDLLNHPCVILTGVGYSENTTGIFVSRGENRSYVSHERYGKSFHGTGDIFAACFTGALIQGENVLDSARIAGEFTKNAIKNTIDNPAHWYGVRFEELLPTVTKLRKI